MNFKEKIISDPIQQIVLQQLDNDSVYESPSLFLNNYLDEYENSQNNQQYYGDNSMESLRTSATTSTQLYRANGVSCGEDDGQNLHSRIRFLQDELASAQADKAFVWTLWRQLQVTSPDLTSAISLVVQREKEKSEIKDQKVLEILRMKDEKILRLSKVQAKNEADLDLSHNKIKELEARIVSQADEQNSLLLSIKTFQDKELMYEQMIRLRDDKYTSLLRENEINNDSFAHQLKDSYNQIENLKNAELKLKSECEHYRIASDSLKKQVDQGNNKYEKLLNELNEFRLAIDNGLNMEIDRLKNELKSSSSLNTSYLAEIDELNKKLNAKVEFITEQNKVIEQLRMIHVDLHASSRGEKENIRLLQSENDSLKQMYGDMKNKYEESVSNESKLVAEIENWKIKYDEDLKLAEQQLRLNERSYKDLLRANKHTIEQMKLETELQISKLKETKEASEDNKLQSIKKSSSIKSRHPTEFGYQKPNGKRSKSVSFQLKAESEDEKLCKSNQMPTLSTNIHRSRISTKNIRSRSAEKSDLNSWVQNSSEILMSDTPYSSKPSVNQPELDTLKNIKSHYENICKYKDEEMESLRNSIARHKDLLLSFEKQCRNLNEQLKSYEISSSKITNKNIEPISRIEKDCEALPFGYIRKETSVLNIELKSIQEEMLKIKSENCSLVEQINQLRIKYKKQSEIAECLNDQLKTIHQSYEAKLMDQKTSLEKEIEKKSATCLSLNRDLENVRQELLISDKKCSELKNDRTNQVDLIEKLIKENKVIFKKWFKLRTKGSKVQHLLIQLIKKCCHIPREDVKVKKTSAAKRKRYPLQGSTILKSKNKIDNQNCFNKRKNQNDLIRNRLKLEENNNQTSMQRIQDELSTSQAKIKRLLEQNENLSNKVTLLKKNIAELKLREEALKKEEEEAKLELKKTFDQRLKSLGTDLSKQIGINKTIKSENEKLVDKLKVNIEKLNHMERDNNQKRQLLEFYKKKLDESSTLKANLESESVITDLKEQIKKANATSEKFKDKIKIIETEKSTVEQKLDSIEKTALDQESKIDRLKREKSNVEATVKKFKSKAIELESYIKNYEKTAENNLKYLSETSRETLDLAQFRITSAFRLATNYEKTFKRVFEGLVNYSIELLNKLYEKQINTIEKNNDASLIDDGSNMQLAMNLAGQFLNLNSNELNEIFTHSMHTTKNNSDISAKKCELQNMIKHRQSLLHEFEQILIMNKNQLSISSDDLNNFHKNEKNNEFSNKKIYNLISNVFEDILKLERDFYSC